MGPTLNAVTEAQASTATLEQSQQLRISEPLNTPALGKAPSPEAIAISAITTKEANGMLHVVRLGEVDVLPLTSSTISPGKMADLLSYTLLPDARGECVKRVMIADTLPSDSIRELVEKLHRAGVEVRYIDHHRGDYVSAGKNYALNEERIAKLLGENCVVDTRENAPSITNLIVQGELAEGGRSLYICAPADIDALSGAMLAANLNPDRLRKPGMDSIVNALGVVDSRIGQYQGTKPGVIDWFNRMRSEIGDDARKLQTAVVGLATAIKDKDVDLSRGQQTRELSNAASIRHETVLQLLKPPYSEFGARSIMLDLSNTGKAHSAFSGRSDAYAKTAMEMMQPGAFDINSLMSYCGRNGPVGSQRNYSEGMIVMVKMNGRDGGAEYGIMLLGKYGQLDFRAAQRDLNMNLRTNIGFKAFVPEANFQKVFGWLKQQVNALDEGPGAAQQRAANAPSGQVARAGFRDNRLRRAG